MKTAKQDLLMFLGTRKEVDQVECINKCLYFAWDTGEFFLGTHHNTKTRYGGTRDSMSKADILKLFQDEYDSEIRNLRTTVQDSNNQVKNNAETLQLGIQALTKQMDDFIEASDAYVENIVESAVNKVDATIITMSTLNTKLQEYYSKTEADNKFVSKESGDSSYMQYMKGSEIALNILKINGLVFCTDSYVTVTNAFQSGAIYRISKGNVTEVAVAGGGGGGGGSSGSTLELFQVNDLEQITVFPDNITRLLSVKMITSVPTEFRSVYVYYDTIQLGQLQINASTNTGSYSIPMDASTSIGNHAIKLVCTMKSGLVSTYTVPYKIVRPIYYGAGTSSTPLLTALTKSNPKSNPSGDYEIEITDRSQYIWFVIPINQGDAMYVKLKKFSANGFMIPTITEEHDDFMYIRSANAIVKSSVLVTVEGGEGAN